MYLQFLSKFQNRIEANQQMFPLLCTFWDTQGEIPSMGVHFITGATNPTQAPLAAVTKP
jgi:hypothetical protein